MIINITIISLPIKNAIETISAEQELNLRIFGLQPNALTTSPSAHTRV